MPNDYYTNAAAPDKKPKKKSGKLALLGSLVVIGLATTVMMPTMVLLLVGLVPTYVAFATDSDPQKSGAVSVGAMNFAGVVPFVIDLWNKGQTMGNVFHILGDSNSWLIILGAAGIGQLIVYAIPQALATLTLTSAEARVKHLRKSLDILKESWGTDVSTNKPLDKLNQN
jgi:hypothetical protein